jgi:hypothetical protein
MAEEKYTFLEDSNGNQSSKRLWGSISMVCGILLSSLLFICAIAGIAANIATCIQIIELLFGTGTVLLGIGVTEDMFKKKDKIQND